MIVGSSKVKSSVVLVTIIATAALGACRKEVEHKPMKLGAGVQVKEQVVR
ncbi:MAG: hypothetical protein ABL898_04730 [Hyphomicrobiaceae bacterium]|nr:hypothetical protein [Hyphomicrobiaceae bacterium]